MDGFDVVIVGTGTAGVAAASQVRAAGKSFAIAEEWLVGGLCNTRGCIPTKTLLKSARAVRDVREAGRFGVDVGEPEVDFAAVMDRARGVSGTRAKGVEDWLPTIGTLLRGSAEVVKPGVVRVGETEVGYESLVFANGSAPFVPPVEGLLDVDYHTSDTIWDLDAQPASVAMLGAGAISLELASFFHAIGTKVTIVQRSDRLLTREDDEACLELSRLLRADGIEVLFGTTTEKAEQTDAGVRLHLRDAEGSGGTVDAEMLLVATGRRAKVDGLGLDRIGVEVGEGGIVVDDRCETGAPGVFAAGDVIGGFMLTDVAYHEGVVAGTNAVGGKATVDERVVPRAIFSIPELGSVGLTETEAREMYGDEVIVGKAPLSRVGKAQADGETEGLAKLIADPDGNLVGAHFLGGPASEVVQVAAMAILGGVAMHQLKDYIPIHPTFAEEINIAALRA